MEVVPSIEVPEILKRNSRLSTDTRSCMWTLRRIYKILGKFNQRVYDHNLYFIETLDFVT